MKLIFLIILFTLSTSITYAQRWQFEKEAIKQLPIHFKMAYLGTIKHPGFKIGLEYPLVQSHYFSKNNTLKKVKEQFLTIHLGYYRHETFHDHWMLNVGYLWRRTNQHGWFTDIEPQVGISKTFLDRTTYKVNDTGNVSKVDLAGYWYANTQFAFAVGKDFSMLEKPIPLKIYLRPSIIVLIPYNNFLYARPAIEIGGILDLYPRNTTVKSFKRKQS